MKWIKELNTNRVLAFGTGLILMTSTIYADWTYAVANVEATIIGYDGELVGQVEIPSNIDGYPVVAIGRNAFSALADLTGLTIPDSVTVIGESAFRNCASLTSVSLGSGITSIGREALRGCSELVAVLFKGDAPPTVGIGLFLNANQVTVYHREQAEDWEDTFAERPTDTYPALVQPEKELEGFSFFVVHSEEQDVAIEATTDLTTDKWTTISDELVHSGIFLRIDPVGNDKLMRFYRLVHLGP